MFEAHHITYVILAVTLLLILKITWFRKTSSMVAKRNSDRLRDHLDWKNPKATGRIRR